MTVREDLRDTAIGLLSTSALLLTRIAVVHLPRSLAVLGAALGLYGSMGCAGSALYFHVIVGRDPLAMKLTKGLLSLAFLAFVIGLVGILFVIVLTQS